MPHFKDNFSSQSSAYAQFRPHYPEALYDFLFSLVPRSEQAWDCATGNGQVAEVLATHFQKVIATDASQAQLDQAKPHPRIEYRRAVAGASLLTANSVDLITVAQAIHWFDTAAFYQEVEKIICPDGILAIWGYGLLRIQPSLDQVIDYLYHDLLGDRYWDVERKHLDHQYRTIDFPYEHIPAPSFQISLEWDIHELKGYLETWSSVQNYIKSKGKNPVDEIAPQLSTAWGEPDDKKSCFWEIYLKVARF